MNLTMITWSHWLNHVFPKITSCYGLGWKHPRGYVSLCETQEWPSLAAVLGAKELLYDHVSTWSNVEKSTGLSSEIRTGFLWGSENVTEDKVELNTGKMQGGSCPALSGIKPLEHSGIQVFWTHRFSLLDTSSLLVAGLSGHGACVYNRISSLAVWAFDLTSMSCRSWHVMGSGCDIGCIGGCTYGRGAWLICPDFWAML